MGLTSSQQSSGEARWSLNPSVCDPPTDKADPSMHVHHVGVYAEIWVSEDKMKWILLSKKKYVK